MNIATQELTIDGIKWVPASSISLDYAPPSDYSIVRADSGLFFGVVTSHTDREAVIENVRQLWSWEAVSGINYLDIAVAGITSNSKVTNTASSITVKDVRSITPCTEAAAKTMLEAPVCRKQ